MDEIRRLIDKIADCLEDNRHASYVKHIINGLLNQGIMLIAADHEYTNACITLCNDEVLKVCCHTENSFSVQPAMSRFWKNITNKGLLKIS